MCLSQPHVSSCMQDFGVTCYIKILSLSLIHGFAILHSVKARSEVTLKTFDGFGAFPSECTGVCIGPPHGVPRPQEMKDSRLLQRSDLLKSHDEVWDATVASQVAVSLFPLCLGSHGASCSLGLLCAKWHAVQVRKLEIMRLSLEPSRKSDAKVLYSPFVASAWCLFR